MKERARDLRRFQTNTEGQLWSALKARRFSGCKFRRQRIIGTYIVDFVCLRKKIIIELDGSQHLDNKAYDQNRTEFLESLGFKVLRFWNNEVLHSWNSVLNTIYDALIETQPSSGPSGHLLPQSGEGITPMKAYTN
jgi:very-short-patch-repair endonuclease